MKLSVIIVSYNVRHYLSQCLLSVQRAMDGIEGEVIVFDNHSKDGSVEWLAPRFPDVTFISSTNNLGFAKANNKAIRQSTGEYVLLLNPDTFIGEQVLRQAIAFMEAHPQAGGLGVQMLKDDGSAAMESRRGIPTPMTAFYKMSGLGTRYPQSKTFGRYYMSYLPWDKPAPIEVISGAFCLLRRKALDRVGLLDETFFMYGEDIDLSYRLLQAGWENWYLPLKILHYKGESTQKSSFRYVHVFYKAMLIFFRKHFAHLSWLIALPVQLAIFGIASVSFCSMMARKVRRSMGFVRRVTDDDPLYVFHCAPHHEEACRRFAHQRGLVAQFVVGDGCALELVGDAAYGGEARQSMVYAVFDMELFSFRHVLEAMAAQTAPRMRIATFYPSQTMMITQHEVIS